MDEALAAYVGDRDWNNAARVAIALNRHLDAARYCLEANRPYDAAVCFQRGGAMEDCLAALIRVPQTAPRYRSACVQAVRVAAMVDRPLESLSSFFMPFIAHAPTAPVEAEAMKSLADVFAQKGKGRLALSIYRTVATAFPRDAEARERLAALERSLPASTRSGIIATPTPSPPSAPAQRTRQRLADLLTSKRLLTKAKLDRLLREQPEVGKSDAALAEALVAHGLVKDVDLLRALSEQTGIGWMSDDDVVASVDPETAKVVTLEQAEQWRVAPLRVIDRHLHVAMQDARDVALVDQLRFATSLKIVPFFATAAGIRRATSLVFHGSDPNASDASAWQGQVFGSNSEIVLEPFSDRLTGTREHQFVTGEFEGKASGTTAPATPAPAPAPSPAPAPTQAAPAVGSKVANRYQLDLLLGEGGSATVYRAQDLELNEPVAIKVFRPMSEREAEGLVARFKQELSLSRILTHPNIIRLFDLGLDQGWRYLTMELLEGEDLATRLEAAGGTLPLEVALAVLEQLCAGLQAVHERGVVHRDIKPQNVFVTNSGVVKLMDFGIARRVNTRGVTVMGTIAGTPEYMSPEQINGFSQVTAPADLYSLGATAYQVLTGVVPFMYPELTQLLVAQATELPKPLRARNPAVPPAVDALVLQLLEKDAAKRPPTAAHVAAVLRQARAALAR